MVPAVLFNAAFAAVVLLAANIYLDYSKWIGVDARSERVRIEASARATDAAYFAQCLAPDHVQMFYPDLVTHNPRFQELAQQTDFLPLGPVPNAATAYCNEGYGFVTYNSDRYGFRNDDSRWDRPVDVLVVGDSFAQGACVPEQYMFSQQLADDLGINAVNIATGSNGPNHYKALIDVFVPMVRPRRVVLVFFPNDNVFIPDEDPYSQASRSAFAKGYTLEGVSSEGADFYEKALPLLKPAASAFEQRMDCRQADLTFPTERAAIAADYATGGSGLSLADYLAYLSEPGRVRGLMALRALRQTVPNLLQPAEPTLASPDATIAALDALMETCSGTCEPAVVFLPTSSYWRPDGRADAYFASVAEHLKHANIPILDAREIVNRDSLSDFAPIGAHLSTEAYRRVGMELGDFLHKTE